MPWAVAFRTGRVVMFGCREAAAAERPETVPYMERNGNHAILATPLESYGRRIGSLTVSFLEPRVFMSDDQEFVKTFASQCAQALDRARLYDGERAARR